MKREVLISAILAIGLLGVGAYGFFNARTLDYEAPSDQILPTKTPKAQESILLFTGDIMLDRNVKKAVMDVGGGDWRFPFMRIAEYLRSADLTMANLEGPVSSRGTRVGSIYSFRFDPAVLEGLQYAGFDIVTIANNHIWDYSQQAFLDTMKHLTDGGISFVGAGNNFDQVHQGVTKTIKDTRITFLGYTDLLSKQLAATPTTAGVGFLDMEQMKKDIQAAKAHSDLVVVNVHKGDEYHTSHNADQELYYHAAIDAGADLVVGHHPHVVEELEHYKDGWIAYSLGNFIFDQYFSEETMQGGILRVTLADKKIKMVELVPVYISPVSQAYLGQ
ncbi:MAG: CapA family protein [Candidatus Yanofskybacteria bacterium]|nr:CapA family protein [Candidatus Yanofskybacteria bacterium]